MAEKELAKWEIKLNDALSKVGSKDAKELNAELKKLLEETDQTKPVGEDEAEERKNKLLERVKGIEARIQYTEEQKEYIQLHSSLKEAEKKLAEKIELRNENPKSVTKKEFSELEKEVKKLEKQIDPYKIIVNGLERKVKTITNRLERAVFSGFGSIIKNRREELGLSLKQIEEQTGISPSYINRIEKGQRKAPSYRIIEQLAKALDLPVSKLTNIAEAPVQNEVPTLEELILTSQFTVNGKRASKQSKEKVVEFIKKLTEASWDSDKKYEEAIKLMGYFDYFKETFSNK